MPCKHRFHSACIKNWLQIRRLCPLCRFIMPLVLEEEEKGRHSIILWTINKKEEGVLMLCSIWVLAHWSIWYFGPYRFQVNSDRNLGSNYGYEIYFEDDSVMDTDLG